MSDEDVSTSIEGTTTTTTTGEPEQDVIPSSTSNNPSHDHQQPSPTSPPSTTTTTTTVESPPSTPPRNESTDASPPSQQQQQLHSSSPNSSPTSTTSSPNSASSSSPSSNSSGSRGGGGGGGGGESNNNHHSHSPSHSNQPPSRRVKVYKLKDDAWVDLGTGTCRGVLIQQNSPPGDNEPPKEGELEREKGKIDPAEEGAWLVVKREKPKKEDKSSPGTTTTTGTEGGNAASGDGDAAKEGGKEEKKKEDDAAAEVAKEAETTTATDDDDDEYEGETILKTRVQPYPPGYSEDFDEEEVEGEDGATLDVGGYQRQQDTLIVWTERGDGNEEVEMALSFATSTGCAEMWEFIKAARRFTAEQAMLSPSPSPSLSSPRTFALHSNFIPSTNQLPTPSLGTIPQLELTIRALSRTAISRERTAIQIVKTGFIEKLIEVHQEAEDLESLEDLHALCRVMQTILLLNDNSIFELVLKDEVILGVAGILEYDPDFPTMKASYRSHLSSPTAFVSLVPIHSSSLLAKIHQTHRLHYLKDVILARILEDATFSMLNSAIYFNEVEIVNEVVGERELVRDVFKILDEGEEEEDTEGTMMTKKADKGKGKEKERELGPKRTIGPELPEDLQEQRDKKKAKLETTEGGTNGHDMDVDPSSSTVVDSTSNSSESTSIADRNQRKQHAIQFLAQLTQMAKNLQLPLRTSLYRTLVERGLLVALEKALRFSTELGDVGLRAQVLAVWMSVVDLDAKDVRAYCLNQGKAKEKSEEEEDSVEEPGDVPSTTETAEKKLEKTLLGGLIETFKVEEDLGIKTQLAEALRVLVDAAGDGGPLEAPPRLQRQEDPEAEKFLQYFYDHCILSLLQPLIDLPERSDNDPPLVLAPAQTALLSHLCDLLCFFIAHHTFRSKYLILSSPQLAKAVSRILRPRPRLTRHTHLRLAALRFFRACVARNDDFYNRFLVKHDLVRAVVETAQAEKDKDNLLGSACLEFFEYVRATNTKALINHLMDRCGETIRNLARQLKTFENLVARWEINNEPPPPPASKGAGSTGEGGVSNGTAGAMSEAMQRQASAPGWPPRMDVEEESYFNTDDDDDDESSPSTGSAPMTATNPAKPIESSSPVRAITSSFFSAAASSRRKRETTSNPSLSSSLSSIEPKRLKLEGEEDPKGNTASSGLPRSQTWPGGGGSGGKGLVDYMDDDEDENDSTLSKKEGGAGPGGGFIREGETLKTDESTEKDSTTASDSSPLSFPLPGSLKRKQEEDEEEDGSFGLLRSKTAKMDSPSSASPRPSTSTPTSTALKKTKALSPQGSVLSKSAGAGGGGGFKIAFGSNASKLAATSPSSSLSSTTPSGPQKGLASTSAAVESASFSPAKMEAEMKEEEEERSRIRKEKESNRGFGKFGGNGDGGTETSSETPSSSASDDSSKKETG